MKTGVWIHFDLGINGDYEGMYAWLDDHLAHECGESLAFVRYDADKNLFEELKADISENVTLAPKNRIYVIFKDDAGNVTGNFLYGRRRRAPWTGYGSPGMEAAADES
jgi:hypothetical protein